MAPPPGPLERRRGRLTCALLLILIAATAFARELGLATQLPTTVVTDEYVYIEHMRAFASDADDPAALPGAGWYPHLVSRIAYATWRAPTCTTADVASHLACASALETHLRRVVAWLSLLAIPGAWLLVRGFAPNATALLASALVATSVFAQVHGQQGRPHAAALGFELFALAFAVRLQRRPKFAYALATGSAVGLALATLQSGLALSTAAFAAVLLARDVRPARRLALAATVLLPCAVAFVGAYPFLFVGAVDKNVQRGHGLLGEGEFGLSLLDGSGFRVLLEALWEYEPLELLATAFLVVVAIASLRRGTRAEGPAVPPRALRPALDPRAWSDEARSVLVLAAYLAPWIVVFGLYQRTYPRYALALMPFLAWGAALLLAPSARRVRAPAAWIPALVVVAVQAGLVARLAIVRARPDTLAIAARWIEREVPPAARIAVLPNDDLPLLRLPGQRAALPFDRSVRHHHWIAYQAHLGPGPWDESARDLVTLEERHPDRIGDALALAGAQYFVWRTFQPGRGQLEAARRSIERCATLVATFRPVDDGDPMPFVPGEVLEGGPRRATWIERLVRADAIGNVVEVWKLDGAR